MKKILLCSLLLFGCASKESILVNNLYQTVMVDGKCAGVIISSNGHIISCAHCLYTSTNTVSISFYNSDLIVPGKILKVDKTIDLMLIKIDQKTLRAKLTCIRPRLGDDIFVIGHPGEFPWSISHGIISGFNRSIGNNNLILQDTQTDAAINPGNSGGGVFNTRGELIGFSEICYTYGRGSVGLNLFIPVSYIKQFLNDYKGIEVLYDY